jgi:pilus assembly protein Flp/PilA
MREVSGSPPPTIMISAVRRVLSDDQGATLVEYGLLLMLVALVCLGVLTTFGTQINAMFSNAANEV